MLSSSPLFFSFFDFRAKNWKVALAERDAVIPGSFRFVWFLSLSLSRQMEAGATKQMFWCEILFLFFATFNGGKIAVCPNDPPSPKQPYSLRLFHTSKALKRHRLELWRIQLLCRHTDFFMNHQIRCMGNKNYELNQLKYQFRTLLVAFAGVKKHANYQF